MIAKQQNTRRIHVLTFLFLVVFSVFFYLRPPMGTIWHNPFPKRPSLLAPLPDSPILWGILLALLGFCLFSTWGPLQDPKAVRNRTLEALGWLFSASCLFFVLGLWALSSARPIWSLLSFLFSFFFQRSILKGTQEDPYVFMEKVKVRLPLTLGFTATLWLILFLLGVIFYKSLGQELPASLFFAAFSLLILRFARTNDNAGLLIAWSLLIAWQVLYVPSGMFFFLAQLVILVLFFIAASLLLRKSPLFSKKLVPRAMNKYNWGKAPQLDALEEDLNRKLNTKKGGRITLQ